MTPVFIDSDYILSPLGSGSAQNAARLQQGNSGIALHVDAAMVPEPFYASLFDKKDFLSDPGTGHTKFERLVIAAIGGALQNSAVDISDKKTVLIISSTKGNIGLLETEPPSIGLQDRIGLYTSAKIVAAHFSHPNQPIVISNACISGSLALLTGFRMIRSGLYDHAVVVGCDVITKFILSGFQSFQAISSGPCKPFDAERSGITLGEASAAVVLSSRQPASGSTIRLAGGAVSNDANHISGPSRTGEELCQAMTAAMRDAGVSTSEIGFVSAHGTATLYNDEMEAKAISLAGLESVPVNSLKGSYGHTLGASGLVESIASVHSLRQNIMLPTKGFNKPGVSRPLHISDVSERLEANCFLKTASGFGGCNAALVFAS